MVDGGNAPQYVKYIIASMSGIGATTICYPLDVIKYRMQVSGELGKPADHANSFRCAKAIFQNEGLRGFYNGLSASIFHQVTYTGTRLGVYQSMLDYFAAKEGRQPNVLQKVFCGMAGGLAGGFVGVPGDIAMTRMAIDGRLPKENRRNYKSVVNALWRIYREEGFLVLFRGTVPTVFRAIVVNVSQFVTYSQTKHFLIRNGIDGDSTVNHILSSVCATIVCTMCAMPADVVKTRLQNMKVVNGTPQYAGVVDVSFKLVTLEGVHALWKGFTPMLLRSLPKSTLLFLFYENQFWVYRNYVDVEKKNR